MKCRLHKTVIECDARGLDQVYSMYLQKITKVCLVILYSLPSPGFFFFFRFRYDCVMPAGARLGVEYTLYPTN